MLEFGGMTVEHRINPRMKHCYVVIEGKGKVVLKTPRIARAQALRILDEKAHWIRKKLHEEQNRTLLDFKAGEEVRYLGALHAVEENEHFDDLAEALGRIRVPSESSLQACYDAFYKNRTGDYLGEKLAHFEQITGLRASAMRVRKMRRRWGSCSSRGVITFNSRIVQLPEELIDYIVVHELAHLRHMDHSAAFYKVVEKNLPEYKSLQKRLRAIRLT